MPDARVTSQGSCIDKEKAGPVEIAPPSPQVIYQAFQMTPSLNNTARDLPALVGCALRHDDKVDATVSFFLSFFR